MSRVLDTWQIRERWGDPSLILAIDKRFASRRRGLLEAVLGLAAASNNLGGGGIIFVIFYSFLVAFLSAQPSQAAQRDQSQRTTIAWPLGRSGQNRMVLEVPQGYGSLDRAARAMDNTVYPNGGRRSNDQIHEDLLLTALWPGLVPDSAQNHREFDQPGGGKVMMALIHSAAIEDYGDRHYNALQADYDIAVEWSVSHLCVGVGAQSRCYQRSAADIKPSKYGLQRLGVDFSKYPDFPEQDRSELAEEDIYFLRGPTGQLQTVILCMAEESKTVEDGPQYHMVAQCDQKFVFEPLNALVSVHYRRMYLHDWQLIQTAWEQLLGSFIVGSSHKIVKGE